MTAPHAKDALVCFATRGFNFATRKTSLDTLVSALKFYTAPFLPTLAVFCVLIRVIISHCQIISFLCSIKFIYLIEINST